jgi:ATP/maltotriose-dependent transcriptional regulator MalT
MAADGLSNREIAHALFLSMRTVEARLSRAYATRADRQPRHARRRAASDAGR